MAETESKTIDVIIGENLGLTSEELQEMELGSEKRVAEAKIFESQARLALDEYSKTAAIIAEENRQNFEMEKFEREMAFKREMEEKRLEIERDKAKSEKASNWAKVALTAGEIAATFAAGVIYLKANFKIGGLVGKDGKKWFDEIRRIKL